MVGCASSPATRYVDLSTISPRSAAPAATSAPLAVGRITLPPGLDRAALVRITAENRLEVDGTVRWPAGLAVVVRRTLAFDLAARLPDGSVALPGQPDPPGDMRLLVVTLERFAASPGGTVVLDGRWSIVDDASQRSLLARDAHIEVDTASSSAADVAHAMSAALARLADMVVSALPEAPPVGG